MATILFLRKVDGSDDNQWIIRSRFEPVTLRTTHARRQRSQQLSHELAPFEDPYFREENNKQMYVKNELFNNFKLIP